jgi:acyl carrier protein
VAGVPRRVSPLDEPERNLPGHLAADAVPFAGWVLHLQSLHQQEQEDASRDPQNVENPESAKPKHLRHAAYNTAMERDALEQRILDVVRAEKTLPDIPLTPETQLAELGIDSLDALNILFALEEAFEITIPDEVSRQIRTLGDLTAAIREAERDIADL